MALRASGVDARVVPHLDRNTVRSLLPEGGQVLVGFPPDGVTDAEIAPGLESASAIVYLSTTGVYGAKTGRVDELTPVDWEDPKARRRLSAEASYLALDATVLRAAGIYGKGRGLHRRLQDPSYLMAQDATKVVCRVHVEDLARIALLSLERAPRRSGGGSGRVWLVADDTPVPQIDVIRWLSDRIGRAMPPFELEVAPLSPELTPSELTPSVPRRRRRNGDRVVDNRRVKAELDTGFAYPSYKEGFEACIEAEKGL